MNVEVLKENSPDRAVSRVGSWLPWAVLALLVAVLVTTLVVTDNSGAANVPAYPSHQLDNPRAPWVFAYLFPVIWFSLLVFFSVQTARKRTFSMTALLFLAGTSMFWIEWPADWGSYLVYNKDFWAIPGWTSTWYQTYWKPAAVISGYGVFFSVECIVLLKIVPRVAAALQRALPKAHPAVLLVASCMGVFYVIDIMGERLMTWCGWYSYVEPVGWAWTSAHGSLSFVWPALPFLLFAIAISLVLRQDANGDYPNEKLFRVSTLPAGWRREFSRLAVWVVTMNIAIFVAQPLFLVVGRLLFLHGSIYVP